MKCVKMFKEENSDCGIDMIGFCGQYLLLMIKGYDWELSQPDRKQSVFVGKQSRVFTVLQWMLNSMLSQSDLYRRKSYQSVIVSHVFYR